MSKPIRVLHVVQRMEAGGTQALLMNLYRNIDRSKVQFDFLVEYPNKEFYDDEIKTMGGKIYYTNVRNDFNLIKFKQTLKYIFNKNPDYKVIHVHASNVGYICFSVAKKMGIKVRIAHAHNNSSVKDLKYFPRLILRKIYTLKATDYFACSNEAGEYFFKNKNYQVINNAIDSNKFIFNEKNRKEIRKELGLSNEFIIGNIGRLHPQKNQLFLLDVFLELKKINNNAKLLIIGTGPLKNEIKNKIKKYKLEDDVMMLGNRSDINKILHSMDVFILPSLFEGLGIVAIEAQAAGIPCIVSEGVSNLSEITPLCKKLSLNNKIQDWVEEINNQYNNPYKFQNMSKYIFDANFDIKTVSKKLQEFYISKSEN